MYLGICPVNLKWMLTEAENFKDKTAIFNGILLLDKMSFQEDFQVVKQSSDWHLIGGTDLGQ